jgi:DNA primase catalytic core
MAFNPKTNDETAHCFSCGATLDIFSAASQIESLPASGPGWIHDTIPALADLLKIPVQLGETSSADKQRHALYRLAQDIADILADTTANQNYVDERGWRTDLLPIGSVDENDLMSTLIAKGWDSTELISSMMVRTQSHSFFGTDKVTFTIKDHRGRPIGFQSRNLNSSGPKYINTFETAIYHKSSALLGLDIAKIPGRENGVYIVEGPGDLAQLYAGGITNAVATCGTALTNEHMQMLRMLSIRTVYLCFDWDAPGALATQRVLESVIKTSPGISVYVVDNVINEDKDPDEFIKRNGAQAFKDLKPKTAFEWLLETVSSQLPLEDLCAKMIPVIASEATAIKREILMRTMSDKTGVSYQSILADVTSIRDNKYQERREELVAAARHYIAEVEKDPENLQAILAQHEQNISSIDKKHTRDTVGVNYQVSRWNTLQEQRSEDTSANRSTEFSMTQFRHFQKELSGGLPWTTGCLMYVGGRANSGKTATVSSLGIDVAFTDTDSTVLLHVTDDSYEQVEPRILASLARILFPHFQVPIGFIVNPYLKIDNAIECRKIIAETKKVMRDLLEKERLCLIDSHDGATLTTLERNMRYYRNRYSSRKLLVVGDNTHNYMDHLHLDKVARMTLISTQQKNLTTTYHACMIATAEYRKQDAPANTDKIFWPKDDDLADARALMYRPNIIFHVYNDLSDRKDDAEIFWTKPSDPLQALPRLVLHFTKNKITSFKEKIVVDLDPVSVTMVSTDKEKAFDQSMGVHAYNMNSEFPLLRDNRLRIPLLNDKEPTKEPVSFDSYKIDADDFGEDAYT